MKLKVSPEKCAYCNQNGIIRCHQCNKLICKDHTGSIHRQLLCSDCFYKERKKGLIKSWVTVGMLGIIATLAIIFLN